MYLKDLIKKLEDLYWTYDDEYKAIAGEPEIMIDYFTIAKDGRIEYQGISPDIRIEKSDDTVYDILSAFNND